MTGAPPTQPWPAYAVPKCPQSPMQYPITSLFLQSKVGHSESVGQVLEISPPENDPFKTCCGYLVFLSIFSWKWVFFYQFNYCGLICMLIVPSPHQTVCQATKDTINWPIIAYNQSSLATQLFWVCFLNNNCSISYAWVIQPDITVRKWSVAQALLVFKVVVKALYVSMSIFVPFLIKLLLLFRQSVTLSSSPWMNSRCCITRQHTWPAHLCSYHLSGC